MLRPSFLLPAAFLAALALPAAARSESLVVDSGDFSVSIRGQKIGREKFAMIVAGDSLVVQARSVQTLPGADVGGTDLRVEKEMGTVTNSFDFGLHHYVSRQMVHSDTLVRGVEATETDTLYSVFRELNHEGEGDRLVLPPGRLFVIDSPPLFATFNVICRTLHGKQFDRRPLSLLLLGARDTVLEVTVTDLGTEPIRWGSRPVTARKLSIGDSTTQFLAWVAPTGKMLRLQQPQTGLRVERDPAKVSAKPPAKRAAAKRPAGARAR